MAGGSSNPWHKAESWQLPGGLRAALARPVASSFFASVDILFSSIFLDGCDCKGSNLLCSLLPLSLVHALTTCVRVDLAGCCRKWKSRGAEKVPESDVALPCVFRIAVAARTFVHGSVRILFVSERRS